MNSDQEIRERALGWAVKSLTWLEQPRNAEGYNSIRWFGLPSTEDILQRAGSFAEFIRNEPKNVQP